jgi:hypothetical protein
VHIARLFAQGARCEAPELDAKILHGEANRRRSDLGGRIGGRGAPLAVTRLLLLRRSREATAQSSFGSYNWQKSS